jgi:hypothetical protein
MFPQAASATARTYRRTLVSDRNCDQVRRAFVTITMRPPKGLNRVGSSSGPGAVKGNF